MKHTKEPWLTEQLENANGWWVLCDSEGVEIGSCDGGYEEDDAKRIIACVNACRGLDTKELEENGLVSAVGSELLRLEAINKELIEAIEIGLGIIEIDPNPGRYEKIKLIESVLTKAKENK